MKTISINELKYLVQHGRWNRYQSLEIIKKGYTDDYHLEHREVGCAYLSSVLNAITITYCEDFSYYADDEDSFYKEESAESAWDIQVESPHAVVDRFGDFIEPIDIIHHLKDFLDLDFKCINYSSILIGEEELNGCEAGCRQECDCAYIDDEELKIRSILLKGERDMNVFTIQVDRNHDIRFAGELLAEVSSNAAGFSNGRWTELYLYKTKAGNYVCHQIGKTLREDERDRLSGKACDSIEEVKKFFGMGWLAKALYEEAGIDTAVDVD